MEPIEAEKEKVKSFDKCPACGSTNRFFAGIVKRMKEQGLIADPKWDFCYDQRTGPVANEQMLKTLPTGAKIPSYFFTTDICSDCGCVHVTKLAEGTAQKQPQIILPSSIPMNRAQRRRIELGRN